MTLESGYFLKHVFEPRRTTITLLIFASSNMQSDFSAPDSTILHTEHSDMSRIMWHMSYNFEHFSTNLSSYN